MNGTSSGLGQTIYVSLVLFLPSPWSDVDHRQASEQPIPKVVVVPHFDGGGRTGYRHNSSFDEQGSENTWLAFIGEVTGRRENAA
jgi:hypothetical protein